ncbi:MAG: hypothetical protein WCK54_20995 [Desulfuromonadales bacterium]
MARAASISSKTALSIIDQVKTSLAMFTQLAHDGGVPAKTSSPITSQIEMMLTQAT